MQQTIVSVMRQEKETTEQTPIPLGFCFSALRTTGDTNIYILLYII